MNIFGSKIYLSKNRTLMAFCFCFMAGAGLFSLLFLKNIIWWLYFVSLPLIFFIVMYWKDARYRFVLLCGLFFILGAWRFSITLPSDPNHISKLNGSYMVLTGEIKRILNVGVDRIQYQLNSSECVLAGSDCGSITGDFAVYLPSYYPYEQGDRLRLVCFLRAPENSLSSSFNYKSYLARHGVWSECAKPKNIELIKKGANDWISIEKFFFKARALVEKQINFLYVMPESALAAGLLYGSRSDFPDIIQNNFNRAGLTHLVAISGYNISIIGVVLMGFLINLGVNRKRAFWFIVSGIIIFVLFVGASASVVRAGIMGIIVLLAGQLGRVSRVGGVLILTAALMLLCNPYVLIWDAGFQLSFAATIGLVYFSPILEHWFAELNFFTHHKNLFKWLRTLLLPSLSAIIFTLPLTLFLFGRFSLVAPLANVLVLGLIPYLMLLGFLSLLLSFMFFPLGQVLAWINWLGLKYVIIVTGVLGGWSMAAIDFKISVWLLIVFYCVLILFIYRKQKKYGA